MTRTSVNQNSWRIGDISFEMIQPGGTKGEIQSFGKESGVLSESREPKQYRLCLAIIVASTIGGYRRRSQLKLPAKETSSIKLQLTYWVRFGSALAPRRIIDTTKALPQMPPKNEMEEFNQCFFFIHHSGSRERRKVEDPSETSSPTENQFIAKEKFWFIVDINNTSPGLSNPVYQLNFLSN